MMHAFVFLALVPAAGNGEDLFKKMESTVLKAKTMEMSFDISIEGGPVKKLEGSLAHMTGKKARMELNGEFNGKSSNMVMVADGTKMRTNNPGGKGMAQDIPEGLDEMFRAIVSRGGVVLPLFAGEAIREGEQPKEFKIDEKLPVSDFRLGKSEKVGDRETQVLEYKLTIKGAKEAFAVTVWLDSKTNLPIKRVISGDMGDKKITITEDYSKLTLDGKLDESKFMLPK